MITKKELAKYYTEGNDVLFLKYMIDGKITYDNIEHVSYLGKGMPTHLVKKYVQNGKLDARLLTYVMDKEDAYKLASYSSTLEEGYIEGHINDLNLGIVLARNRKVSKNFWKKYASKIDSKVDILELNFLKREDYDEEFMWEMREHLSMPKGLMTWDTTIGDYLKISKRLAKYFGIVGA